MTTCWISCSYRKLLWLLSILDMDSLQKSAQLITSFELLKQQRISFRLVLMQECRWSCNRESLHNMQIWKVIGLCSSMLSGLNDSEYRWYHFGVCICQYSRYPWLDFSICQQIYEDENGQTQLYQVSIQSNMSQMFDLWNSRPVLSCAFPKSVV